MLGKASAALRVGVVSVLLGHVLVDAFVSLGKYFADDVISVPAVAPFLCELKVEACSNADLLVEYKDFVSVEISEWSQWHCHTRRTRLWKDCGAEAKVVIRYNGPVAAGPVLEDGSWLIQMSDKIVLALLPISLRPDHRCFRAKELAMTSTGNITTVEKAQSVKEAEFCVPAVDVVGYPKCGTSAAYELVVTHNATLAAANRKETCIIKHGKINVWEWIEKLASNAKDSTEKLLVNGCINPVHHLHQEVLFRLYERPNVKLYVVRDLASRLWSAWNFWCDPKREQQCDGGQWTKIGVHERSPERFQELLLESAEKHKSVFSGVPTPKEMEKFYLPRYWLMDSLSSFHLVVYAKEKLEADPDAVWERVATTIKEVYGRELAPHESLHLFSEVLVNSNDHKGVGSLTKIGDVVEGTYEISGHRPMLEESRRLIMESWKECSFWASQTDWQYSCVA